MKQRMKHIALNVLLLLICLLIGLLIALQLKNVETGRQADLINNASADELKEMVADLREANADLAEENEKQKNNLRELQNTQENTDIRVQQLRDEIQRLEIFAGLVEVQGSGAVITVTDGQNNKVDGSMLITIVNQLRAGGAQGIAINSQRLVAMSEIQTTGTPPNTNIVINGTVAGSGNGIYTIRAIGDRQVIQSTYDMMSATINYYLLRGIGVQIDYVDSVTLPALSADSPAYRYGEMSITQSD
ncbi:MAG: DUF881 domain-containing protein [Oscillospiraceae bacterium]|nr:DUF881 domain-containing protein [Oscillospiraceae bacterium]MDD4368328.1 DUF881 domain-containing protein [Oscillospiraceae bacterium]